MKTDGAISMRDRILGGLWGSLVGDALGVPVEFKDRATLQADPVTDMREYGTYRQPRGTWSDDGAIILCTVDSLVNDEFNLDDMGSRFVRWVQDGLWTAHGDVFDVGGTTRTALMRITQGTPADQAGGITEESNGNGSLMRILPIILRFAAEPAESFANRVERASAITHGHARSRMACVLDGLVVRYLLKGSKPLSSLNPARVEFTNRYERSPEFRHFRHLLEDDFFSLPESMVVSTGYVLHTLHASLWCLLNTFDFRECVLKAVNLGGDSDTTGCVTGGLAGVLYGVDKIPPEWIGALPRRQDLDRLFNKFTDVCVRGIGEAME
jgi:ADP-ribosyl-[dinitrogen reductase] hydrolase